VKYLKQLYSNNKTHRVQFLGFCGWRSAQRTFFHSSAAQVHGSPNIPTAAFAKTLWNLRSPVQSKPESRSNARDL